MYVKRVTRTFMGVLNHVVAHIQHS